MLEFKAWPKIPRLCNERYTFTEKIDGTNAAIIIGSDGSIGCQSRSRIITLDEDNFGFARWVQTNREELMGLGIGHHYGEWWGAGINRGYDVSDKRFSLFNVGRWDRDNIPTCCNVVPTIAANTEEVGTVYDALYQLAAGGSLAAPGYMRPEGIIIYSHAAKSYHKILLDK